MSVTSNKFYVRDTTEDGLVVIRCGDHQFHLNPLDALDMTVRILNVKTESAWADNAGNKTKVTLFRPRVKDDLIDDRRPGAAVSPQITTDQWGKELQIHTDQTFRREGYEAAQRDIKVAIGFDRYST